MFDRSRLALKPLSERQHDLALTAIITPDPAQTCSIPDDIRIVAQRITSAKARKSSVVLMIGAHVIRSGVQRYIVDLMERGYISCLSMNGAGMIHDYEFSKIGATTESVARYIKDGQFGLWKETGVLNDIINDAYYKDRNAGMGQAVGREIAGGVFPHRENSLLAAGYKLNIPVTIHIGIGQDIIHEHPNCDGAATGAASYNDFLRFTNVLQGLDGGVVMNFGSSVMAPEVYLKALSMVRNRARQEAKEIRHFTVLVCDLYPLPSHFRNGPSKEDAAYYFRPWKTMLVRTVADGGESFYVNGRHSQTIPALWAALNEQEKISLK